MLRELKIENLAIIDSLHLEFDEGFIVLTGETGAGKSIILSAINLLIGEKASTEMIRDGEEYLLAQGVFEITERQARALEKFDLNIENNEVIVRRQHYANGKGKTYVNGIRVTITDLKAIMGELVDIVGQHSHQMLLNKNNHRRLLDSFISKEDRTLKKELALMVQKYRDLKSEFIKTSERRNEVLEKKEFYEYQLEELKKLKLKQDEEEFLEEEYNKLFNAGRIKEKLSDAIYNLRDAEDNVLSLLKWSVSSLEFITDYDKEIKGIMERLDSSFYEIEDCCETLNQIDSELEMDDRRLDLIGRRLETINSFKKKYGKSYQELYNLKLELEEKISLFDEGFFMLQDLEAKLSSTLSAYKDLASRLSLIRHKIASLLEEKLEEELKFLNMEATQVRVNFTQKESVDIEGEDDIEFLISTNVGQSLKPLSKIASGGEVSRVMLALKVIFSRVDNIAILIFDEIDVGVGGETVRKIADKIREIGKHAQVISITHSPQIAAVAKQQFFIEKKVINDKTITKVRELTGEERVDEIARMLVGENITKDARILAKNMLIQGR